VRRSGFRSAQWWCGSLSGKWAGSDRKARLPPDWEARRAFVLRRDGWQCTELVRDVRCPQIATDVDHIIPGDDHSYGNLTSLCGPHHDLKSSREGAAAKARIRNAKRRPPETHPALR